MIGIYKITNLINNKVYIGQSINIEKRIKEHFWKANCKNDISFNSILHQAIRKYGQENFIWEILEECSIENIDLLEQKYIKEFNSIAPYGYNILHGGQKNRTIPHFCPRCNKSVTREGLYCVECGHFNQRIVERPTREELKEMIRKETFVSIAKKYKVSDKAISKWCKAYNLPFTKKEIKKYTVQEWLSI